MQIVNRSGIIREFIVPVEHGSCESCGLPHHSGKLMRIPVLQGLYCSVLCAEQAIYKRGCRWCGEKPEPDESLKYGKFCSESCRQKKDSNIFGNGRQLIAWLRAHDYRLPKDLGQGDESCAYCGGTLIGKRSDSVFCSPRCKMAHRRLGPNPEKGQIAVTAAKKTQDLSNQDFQVKGIGLPAESVTDTIEPRAISEYWRQNHCNLQRFLYRHLIP